MAVCHRAGTERHYWEKHFADTEMCDGCGTYIVRPEGAVTAWKRVDRYEQKPNA
jgi:hypothetical protein